MPIRVLELRSVWGAGGGPEKTILLGAARASRDIAVTVCYVRDARDREFRLDATATQLGVDYTEIIERHSFDVQIWPALTRLIDDRQIDIVHAHDYKTDLLALAAARGTRTVPLATAHGWSGNSSWRERRVYYPIDRRILSRYPHVIAVSRDIAEALEQAGLPPARVTVMLNGVDADVFRRRPERVPDVRARLGIPEGAFVVGAIGRLEQVKRLDVLIEAVASVRQAHPQVMLLLAGDGSQRAALQHLADVSTPGACRFLGQVSDVVDLHHALDCFVQASEYEGTSNSLLEAMAMETPVVATAAGGTADVVRDGVDGLLVEPGDSAGLADAIRNVVEHETARRDRVGRARERAVTDLSFDARTRRLEDIYRSLMPEGGRDA